MNLVEIKKAPLWWLIETNKTALEFCLMFLYVTLNIGLSSYNEQVQKTTLTLTVFVKPFLKEFFLFEIHMDVIHKIIKNITLEPMYDFLVNLVL